MKKGFTLIELLVVISIIVIIAAILMPVISKVREQTRKTVCANNLNKLIFVCTFMQRTFRVGVFL